MNPDFSSSAKRRWQARSFIAALLSATMTYFLFPVFGFAEDKRPAYIYEDTRRLVALVEDAAALMERKGESAFAEFKIQGSKWLTDPYYLFVYGIDGTCVFHPIQPDLIGKNLMSLRDMDGKPVIRFITDIGRRTEKDASGWVFYLWPDKTQLMPLWKSAYIRKVVAPGNKTYLVGSGIYNIKTEKSFVEERVRMASALLQVKGKDTAFQEFRSRASPFVFLDTYIFVLDMQGRTVVDPAYPTLTGRDLSAFHDAVGGASIQEMLRKLQHGNEAWVEYLWPRPGASLPSRKLIYARKVRIGNDTFIVGSDLYLATPIWMRG